MLAVLLVGYATALALGGTAGAWLAHHRDRPHPLQLPLDTARPWAHHVPTMTNTTKSNDVRADLYVLNGTRWDAERLDCPIGTALTIAADLLKNGRKEREVWIGPVGMAPVSVR
jgi:hypothetical protein